MNVSQNIDKLLKALQYNKNKLYKINSFKFYSEKSLKYTAKYQIWKKKIVEEHDLEKNETVLVERYVNEYECYSKVDILKYLAEEYKKEGEANGI